MASVANLLRPGFIDWHRQPHLRRPSDRCSAIAGRD